MQGDVGELDTEINWKRRRRAASTESASPELDVDAEAGSALDFLLDDTRDPIPTATLEAVERDIKATGGVKVEGAGKNSLTAIMTQGGSTLSVVDRSVRVLGLSRKGGAGARGDEVRPLNAVSEPRT